MSKHQLKSHFWNKRSQRNEIIHSKCIIYVPFPSCNEITLSIKMQINNLLKTKRKCFIYIFSLKQQLFFFYMDFILLRQINYNYIVTNWPLKISKVMYSFYSFYHLIRSQNSLVSMLKNICSVKRKEKTARSSETGYLSFV